MVNMYYYLPGFIHPRWYRISINSNYYQATLDSFGISFHRDCNLPKCEILLYIMGFLGYPPPTRNIDRYCQSPNFLYSTSINPNTGHHWLFLLKKILVLADSVQVMLEPPETSWVRVIHSPLKIKFWNHQAESSLTVRGKTTCFFTRLPSKQWALPQQSDFRLFQAQ